MGIAAAKGLAALPLPKETCEMRWCSLSLSCFPYLRPYAKPVKATMTSKGQITIPLAIRRKLNLRAGTVLDFDEQADHLRALKCVDADRMRSAIGIARTELAGRSVTQWLDELRGPAELPPRKGR